MTTTLENLDTPGAAGLIARRLEQELGAAVARKGLVIWLDGGADYVRFAERLARQTELGYRVVGFSGSYLELMLALEPLTGGVDRPHLVLHLPGLNADSVKATPALELYLAGTTFSRKLSSLVKDVAGGQVLADRVDAYLESDGVTLEGADAWLQTELSEGDDGLRDQMVLMGPVAVLENLRRGGDLAQQAQNPVVLHQLQAWFGLPTAWAERFPTADGIDLESAAVSWAMVVEYVSDLGRPPVQAELREAAGLHANVVEHAKEVTTRYRSHHPKGYVRLADETEALLSAERAAARGVDLGHIDTFRFEAEVLLRDALAALEVGDWKTAQTFAAERLSPSKSRRGKTSFWVDQDLSSAASWQLVEGCAALEAALSAAGPELKANTHQAAVEAYELRGAAVDRTHRELAQLRLDKLNASIEQYEAVRARVEASFAQWGTWADSWARGYGAVCRAEGFLPPPELRQRGVVDGALRPQLDEPTAYFVVDALRYEMGAVLRDALSGGGEELLRLEARLAELPTVTEVGMNVLALAGSGEAKLEPELSDTDGGKIQGFRMGSFRVKDPDSRQRALREALGSTTLPWLKLEELPHAEAASLKRQIAQAKVFVVHGTEIDKAGESGAGLHTFERALQRIHSAYRILLEAGVKRFVITSDHGFLILSGKAKRQPFGQKSTPQRRHVFRSTVASDPEELAASLTELGYGAEGHVVMPLSTAVFDRGERDTSFVHGGASLQERVIPLLTVVHRKLKGSRLQGCLLETEARDAVGDMQCLVVRLRQEPGALPFSSEIELALRATGRDEIAVELVSARNATQSKGAFSAKVGAEVEVFFRLRGASDERVRVEVFNPTRTAPVAPSSPDARFDVIKLSKTSPPKPVADAPPEEGEQWWEAFEDPAVRQAMQRIYNHGSVTESELNTIFGTPRKARQFSAKIEEHAKAAPFRIRTDLVGQEKRHVREGSGPR